MKAQPTPSSLGASRLSRQVRRLKLTAWRVAVVAFVTAALVYVLFPFYWMLKSSFQTNVEVVASPPIWLPRTLSLEGYVLATRFIPFAQYVGNSLIVSLVTTVVCCLFASMSGYVLSRFRFPGASLILGVILFAQLVPGTTRIFPVYFLIQRLGLLNTYLGLIIAFVGFSLPYATLMLQGYLRTSCPMELEEAAMIDGCNWFTAFLRIVLPISAPGITAISFFAFLGAWNDFLWSSLLSTVGDLRTIQVGLRFFMGEQGGGGGSQVNAFMAACVMTMIPGLVLFRLGQRYIVRGISAGAMKG